MRWEGSAMLRWSPRRTLEAIVTQAFALIVALGKTDLKRSATKQAQSKASNCRAVRRARGGSFLEREVAALIKKAAAAK